MMMPRDSNDLCPVSYALALFGDRWTLRILRVLLLDKAQRFREFEAAIAGIASNILSNRLKRLEASGLIGREQDPLDGRQKVYKPTNKAIGILPILLEMIVWSARNEASLDDAGLVQRYDDDRAGLILELSEQARCRVSESEPGFKENSAA